MAKRKYTRRCSKCITRQMTEAEKYELDLKLAWLEERDKREEEFRMNYLRWKDGQTYNVRI